MLLMLSQARARKGISQADFARALGVSVSTLRKFEKDQGTMRVSQAYKAAKLLDFTFNGVSFIET